MKMNRFNVPSCLLAALMFCSGCTSVYSLTIQEMTQPQHELVAGRISEAHDNLTRAREAFSQSAAQLTQLRESAAPLAADDPDALALEHALARAELEAWNLQRRIASIGDVSERLLDDDPGQFAAGRNEDLHERCRDTLIHLQRAHQQMQVMLGDMRHKAMVLRVDAEPHADSVDRRILLIDADHVHRVDQSIAEAISSTEAFLALLESTGDTAVTDPTPDSAPFPAAAQ